MDVEALKEKLRLRFSKKWLIGISVFLLIAVVIWGMYSWVGSFTDFASERVRVSNVTSSSVTISWVTKKAMSGRVMYAKKSGIFGLGSAIIHGQFAYDDRDVSRYEAERSSRVYDELRADTSTDSVERTDYEVLAEDVKVKEKGKFYVHHVTISGLDPDTQYYFSVGNGMFFNDSASALASDTLTSMTEMKFSTRPKLDSPLAPSPAYGAVLSQDADDVDTQYVVRDGVVYMFVTNGEGGALLSSPLNDTGKWYIDLTTARDSEGEIMLFNEDSGESAFFVEAGPRGDSGMMTLPMDKDAPADRVILGAVDEKVGSMKMDGVGVLSQMFSFLSNSSGIAKSEDRYAGAVNGLDEGSSGKFSSVSSNVVQEDGSNVLKSNWYDGLNQSVVFRCEASCQSDCEASCHSGCGGSDYPGACNAGCANACSELCAGHAHPNPPPDESEGTNCEFTCDNCAAQFHATRCKDGSSQVCDSVSRCGTSGICWVGGGDACGGGDGEQEEGQNPAPAASGGTCTCPGHCGTPTGCCDVMMGSSDSKGNYCCNSGWQTDPCTGSPSPEQDDAMCCTLSSFRKDNGDIVICSKPLVAVNDDGSCPDNSSVADCDILACPSHEEGECWRYIGGSRTCQLMDSIGSNCKDTDYHSKEECEANNDVDEPWEGDCWWYMDTKCVLVDPTGSNCDAGYHSNEECEDAHIHEEGDDGGSPVPESPKNNWEGECWWYWAGSNSCSRVDVTMCQQDNRGYHSQEECERNNDVYGIPVTSYHWCHAIDANGKCSEGRYAQKCSDIYDIKKDWLAGQCPVSSRTCYQIQNLNDPIIPSCWVAVERTGNCNDGEGTEQPAGMSECKHEPEPSNNSYRCYHTTYVTVNHGGGRYTTDDPCWKLIDSPEPCREGEETEPEDIPSCSKLEQGSLPLTPIQKLTDIITPTYADEKQFVVSGNYVIEPKTDGVYTLYLPDRMDPIEVVLQKGKKYMFFEDSNGNGQKDEEEKEIDLSSEAVEIKYDDTKNVYKKTLKEGLNFVSFNKLPAESNSCDFISSVNMSGGATVSQIAYFDSAKNRFVVTEQRADTGSSASGNCFTLVPGRGYIIKTFGDVEIAFEGFSLTAAAPIQFSNVGWNLIGVNGSDTKYTAESMIDSMNELPTLTVDNVTRWRTDSARYDGLQKEKDDSDVYQVYGFDFPILPGVGYFVQVSEGSGQWTP